MTEAIKYTSSNYHYLMATYNWIAENNGIQYLVVPLDCVPQQIHHLGRDGIIVLNIGMSAAPNLDIQPDAISFSARFSGVSVSLCIPMDRVIAIFDRDHPQKAGFTFHTCKEEVAGEEVPPEPPKLPGLSLVK